MKDGKMKVRLHARQICIAALCVLVLSLAGFRISAQEVRKVMVRETPTYPEIAKTIHLTGTVKVQVVVNKDGYVRETKVLGGHPLLVDATREALKKWKYAPAPAETTTQLEFSFHP